MTQQFSPTQQAMIDSRLRIAKLPKSSRRMYDVVVGDLLTDGYRFFVVSKIESYNGYKKQLLTLFSLEEQETQYTTTPSHFTIMETLCK